MRAAWLAALGVLVGARTARATTPHEVYLQAGGVLFSSPSRTMAGLGGGVGYRLHLGEYVSLYTELRDQVFIGQVGSATLGVLVAPRIGASWRPALGLQGIALAGDQIRVVSAQAPDPVPPIAWAVQLRLVPLRFAAGDFTVAVLAVDVGGGLEDGNLALAVSVSLLEIGLRL